MALDSKIIGRYFVMICALALCVMSIVTSVQAKQMYQQLSDENKKSYDESFYDVMIGISVVLTVIIMFVMFLMRSKKSRDQTTNLQTRGTGYMANRAKAQAVKKAEKKLVSNAGKQAKLNARAKIDGNKFANSFSNIGYSTENNN